MSDDGRSADRSRLEPILRPLELYALTGAPEYDDEVKEWKVTGRPVRTIWGFVSGGDGEWIGGGHRVDGTKRRWRQESEREDTTIWLPDWWRKANSERALEAPPPLWVGERVYVADIDGILHVTTNYADRLVGFCLAENHPGKGVEMDVYAGILNVGDQKWEYACTSANTFKAIHWRFGTPEPEAGATGLGQWRESTDNGAILEIVVGDCSSPGPCCA